ncbi:MAG: hypothetical protein AAF558_13655 [Verrucomicrobiota bacterium]
MTENEEFYLYVGEEVHGPFSRTKVVQGLATGEVPENTMATNTHGAEWLPLCNIVQVAQADDDLDDLFGGQTMVIPK